MEINGKTKIYGIIGNPIEHTLSPLMHGMFADAAGLDTLFFTHLTLPTKKIM